MADGEAGSVGSGGDANLLEPLSTNQLHHYGGTDG